MRALFVAIALALVVTGCNDKPPPGAPAAATQPPASTPTTPAPAASAPDLAAGKIVAERDCKGCHGLDGKGVAPGIPNLAAQRDRYLLASLNEYKQGKRAHAALKDMMSGMSDSDARNVVAYYASLPALSPALAKGDAASPFEEGKRLAAACTKCHGEDGNSKVSGTPSLAGQQPHYLVTAIQEYHAGARKTGAMKAVLPGTDRLELEKLALYFASQTPASRPKPGFGDVAAGEPMTAICGGCHGARGVSNDAATPSLAGQDAQYLVKSIKAYRTTRQHWGMQRFVAGLSDKDMENIAAFYVVQKGKAADAVPASTRELADKCNRCHDADASASLAAPKMRGQDKDYLAMALRAYRDGRRESSTMHNMSFVYANSIIESLATWYASQPAN